MQGIAVGVRVHRDAAEAGVLAGADDPDGDLAPVGDEYLAHLGGSSRRVTDREFIGRPGGPNDRSVWDGALLRQVDGGVVSYRCGQLPVTMMADEGRRRGSASGSGK
ncbi:hypothetical protein Xph01_17690 [Micromonospora phaseoli]|nr:hypothetical protein Xph01_17690 [Micromonospora phaseoli]